MKTLGSSIDDLVVDRVLVDAREALDDVQLLALRNRSNTLGGHVGRDAALVVVAGDVHDEGVAFPTTPGIAVPQAEARPEMRTPVERNDARFVDHLVDDRHVAGTLQDLVPRAVAGREDPARHATRDAPLPRRVKFTQSSWMCASL